MKKNTGSMVTTGIPSIFLVFSVLCLVILCLLAAGTSRSDLRLSEISMQNTAAYYDAASYATELCLSAEAAAKNTPSQARDLQSIISCINEFLEEEISDEASSSAESTNAFRAVALADYAWSEDLRCLTLTISYTDRLALLVETDLSFDGTDLSQPELFVRRWYTTQIGTWEPDTHQEVFVPSQSDLFQKKNP